MRGTLSIKDALTDMSPSMEKISDDYHISGVEGAQYIHKVSNALSYVVRCLSCCRMQNKLAMIYDSSMQVTCKQAIKLTLYYHKSCGG